MAPDEQNAARRLLWQRVQRSIDTRSEQPFAFIPRTLPHYLAFADHGSVIAIGIVEMLKGSITLGAESSLRDRMVRVPLIQSVPKIDTRLLRKNKGNSSVEQIYRSH